MVVKNTLKSLKIEVNFVVEKTKQKGGKIDLKIVDIGQNVTYSNQQVHKIFLELKTCHDTHKTTSVRKLENEDQTPFITGGVQQKNEGSDNSITGVFPIVPHKD